jgi:glutaredoxin
MKKRVALALAAGFAGLAQAQYKVVGPDGKITYTDRPPVGTKGQPVGSGSTGGGVSTGNLPYELRQVVSRFPVTLYTSTDCSPCDNGRALLKQRGVPFVERTVSSTEDAEALKRLEGLSNVPVLRIGGQQLKGFSADDWNGYLTTAGYPAQSSLPAGYSNPAPTPLAPRRAADTSPAAPREQNQTPAVPSGTTSSGFRF